MTTRTVQIFGYGFGATDATINVTHNGNVIFNGTVTTTDQPIPELPNLDLTNETVQMYSFDVPVDFSGTIPVTCTATNGTVAFCQIKANYVPLKNPVFTPDEWAVLANTSSTNQQMYDIVSVYANPPFTQEETDTLLNPSTSRYFFFQTCKPHNVDLIVSSGANNFVNLSPDPRSSVFINQVEQVADHTTYPGTWWWIVNDGSTMSYNLTLKAGIE